MRQILEHYLIPEFGKYFIDALTPEQVEAYKKRRRQKAKSATIVKELRTLKALINRAVDLELIAKNPVKIVKPPKLLDSKPHRYYTKAELEQLYAATKMVVNGGATNPEHGAWWKFLANCGLRRMEALHLKRKDIGSDGLRILSTEEERTKSGQWRDVPLTTGAKEALESIPKRSDGFVLPRIQPASLSRAAIEDAERAGIGGSLHTLRHTYISHLVLAGVPLRTVQLYAGHSSITVTEKYAYLIPDRAVGPAVEMNL